MAEPRTSQRKTQPAESKRGALVLAAYRELAEHGFEGLRTREIAAAVGVNIATLHYYFPHKQDLVRSVVGYAMARFRSTLPVTGSAAEQLRAHFRGLRSLSREEPELFRVMGELALRAARDPAIATILRKTDDAWHATLRSLLQRAREGRAVDAGLEPDAMAGLIVAALKGTFLLPRSPGHRARLDGTLRQLERSLGLTRQARAAGRKSVTAR